MNTLINTLKNEWISLGFSGSLSLLICQAAQNTSDSVMAFLISFALISTFLIQGRKL